MVEQVSALARPRSNNKFFPRSTGDEHEEAKIEAAAATGIYYCLATNECCTSFFKEGKFKLVIVYVVWIDS